MNQSIQFPDREEWDEVKKSVRFPVLVNGMLAECMISQSLLSYRYGDELPLILFQRYRWDIEEEFEALVEQGFDDDNGFYILPDDK